MAAAEPLQSIKAEVTCSICRELFRDPVTSECGHSFCRECIARLCQGDGDFACPQCQQKLQQRHLLPSLELKNIVESLKLQPVGDPRGGNVCKTHQEPLRCYCKEDQTPVCVACERSQAHRTHTVVPVKEAVQEHRVDVKGLVRRFEEWLSPGPSEVSAGEEASVSQRRKGAAQTESGGDTGRRGQVSEKPKAAAGGVHRGARHSPVPLRRCNIQPPSGTHQQVDAQQTENRPENGSSPTPAEESGGSSSDATSASSEEEGKGVPAGGQVQPPQLDPPPTTAAAVAPATSTAPGGTTVTTTATAVAPATSTAPGTTTVTTTTTAVAPATSTAPFTATTPATATDAGGGAAMGSRNEAAGEGQQHPGRKAAKKKKKKKKPKLYPIV